MVDFRLERWIRSNYADISADAVIRTLAELAHQPDAFGRQISERVIAAVAFAGRGDMDRFRYAADLVHIDWRDVLVLGGLANESWPDDLERRLGQP